MQLQLSSDRYEHDMTADKFLGWLRTLPASSTVAFGVDGPWFVVTYLTSRGYKVADACYETVTLIDWCGCTHVRGLPTALTRSFTQLAEYNYPSVFTLVALLEARI